MGGTTSITSKMRSEISLGRINQFCFFRSPCSIVTVMQPRRKRVSQQWDTRSNLPKRFELHTRRSRKALRFLSAAATPSACQKRRAVHREQRRLECRWTDNQDDEGHADCAAAIV